MVEISTENSCLYIAALSTHNSECYALKISDRSVIKSFGSDFSVMATCLGFRGDKLVLRLPKADPSRYYDRNPANLYVATDYSYKKDRPLNLNSERSLKNKEIDK